MSWGEAGGLPDSKNLVEDVHMQPICLIAESWRGCLVAGLQPAEPSPRSPTVYFQGSHNPYAFNFHELNHRF